MSMRNYFSAGPLLAHVMAATNQPVGVDHLTVVPENFESETCPDCDAHPCEC